MGSCYSRNSVRAIVCTSPALIFNAHHKVSQFGEKIKSHVGIVDTPETAFTSTEVEQLQIVQLNCFNHQQLPSFCGAISSSCSTPVAVEEEEEAAKVTAQLKCQPSAFLTESVLHFDGDHHNHHSSQTSGNYDRVKSSGLSSVRLKKAPKRVNFKSPLISPCHSFPSATRTLCSIEDHYCDAASDSKRLRSRYVRSSDTSGRHHHHHHHHHHHRRHHSGERRNLIDKFRVVYEKTTGRYQRRLEQRRQSKERLRARSVENYWKRSLEEELQARIKQELKANPLQDVDEDDEQLVVCLDLLQPQNDNSLCEQRSCDQTNYNQVDRQTIFTSPSPSTTIEHNLEPTATTFVLEPQRVSYVEQVEFAQLSASDDDDEEEEKEEEGVECDKVQNYNKESLATFDPIKGGKNGIGGREKTLVSFVRSHLRRSLQRLKRARRSTKSSKSNQVESEQITMASTGAKSSSQSQQSQYRSGTTLSSESSTSCSSAGAASSLVAKLFGSGASSKVFGTDKPPALPPKSSKLRAPTLHLPSKPSALVLSSQNAGSNGIGKHLVCSKSIGNVASASSSTADSSSSASSKRLGSSSTNANSCDNLGRLRPIWSSSTNSSSANASTCTLSSASSISSFAKPQPQQQSRKISANSRSAIPIAPTACSSVAPKLQGARSAYHLYEPNRANEKEISSDSSSTSSSRLRSSSSSNISADSGHHSSGSSSCASGKPTANTITTTNTTGKSVMEVGKNASKSSNNLATSKIPNCSPTDSQPSLTGINANCRTGKIHNSVIGSSKQQQQVMPNTRQAARTVVDRSNIGLPLRPSLPSPTTQFPSMTKFAQHQSAMYSARLAFLFSPGAIQAVNSAEKSTASNSSVVSQLPEVKNRNQNEQQEAAVQTSGVDTSSNLPNQATSLINSNARHITKAPSSLQAYYHRLTSPEQQKPYRRPTKQAGAAATEPSPSLSSPSSPSSSCNQVGRLPLNHQQHFDHYPSQHAAHNQLSLPQISVSSNNARISGHQQQQQQLQAQIQPLTNNDSYYSANYVRNAVNRLNSVNIQRPPSLQSQPLHRTHPPTRATTGFNKMLSNQLLDDNDDDDRPPALPPKGVSKSVQRIISTTTNNSNSNNQHYLIDYNGNPESIAAKSGLLPSVGYSTPITNAPTEQLSKLSLVSGGGGDGATSLSNDCNANSFAFLPTSNDGSKTCTSLSNATNGTTNVIGVHALNSDHFKHTDTTTSNASTDYSSFTYDVRKCSRQQRQHQPGVALTNEVNERVIIREELEAKQRQQQQQHIPNSLARGQLSTANGIRSSSNNTNCTIGGQRVDEDHESDNLNNNNLHGSNNKTAEKDKEMSFVAALVNQSRTNVTKKLASLQSRTQQATQQQPPQARILNPPNTSNIIVRSEDTDDDVEDDEMMLDEDEDPLSCSSNDALTHSSSSHRHRQHSDHLDENSTSKNCTNINMLAHNHQRSHSVTSTMSASVCSTASTASSFCFENGNSTASAASVAATYGATAGATSSTPVTPTRKSRAESSASCSTTVSSTKESNKDFLIDDEIADQPDLFTSSSVQVAASSTTVNSQAPLVSRSHFHLPLEVNSPGTPSSDCSNTPTNNPLRSANHELESLILRHQFQQQQQQQQQYQRSMMIDNGDDVTYNSLPHYHPQQHHYSHHHTQRNSHTNIDRSRSFSFQNATATTPSSSSNCGTTPTTPTNSNNNNNNNNNNNQQQQQSILESPRIANLRKRHSYTAASSSGGHTSPSSSFVHFPHFRKPRPLSFVENEDGTCGFDLASLRAVSQDMIGIKTLLFRLQGVLQNAETQNPFESSFRLSYYGNNNDRSHQHRSSNRSSLDSLHHERTYSNCSEQSEQSDARTDAEMVQSLKEEAFDMRQHIALIEQELIEKDRTIRLLQQQMAKYSTGYVEPLPALSPSSAEKRKAEMTNSTTQTESNCGITEDGINPRALSDGSTGQLIRRKPVYL